MLLSDGTETALIDTVGAIVVAVLGGGGARAVVNRNRKRAQAPTDDPKPDALRDERAENRYLRARLDDMDKRIDDMRVYREVVDILLPHIEVILPNLTFNEKQTIERVRRMRAGTEEP